ncbi:1-acyl-sn-glycerol-3-phosphate acyltransferase [subsurface metagenome]
MVRILFSLLTCRRVKGRENIPRQGPVLVVANHIEVADVPLLAVSLSRRVIFMAKKELFRSKFLAYLMHSLGAFPVRRGRSNKQALRQAEQVLAEGLALVMFPEGTRSRHGQLQPAFSGSALIALRSGAPILPVGISGTEKIKGVAWLLHRPQITVNIGQPFYLSPVDSKLTKDKLAELTGCVMERIAKLLPQEYGGSYLRKEVAKHEN